MFTLISEISLKPDETKLEQNYQNFRMIAGGNNLDNFFGLRLNVDMFTVQRLNHLIRERVEINQ